MVSTFKRLEYLLWNGVHISIEKFVVHFRPGGLRVVRYEDDGAAFGAVEGGMGAVRLYYSAHSWRP